jgi:hypothetical protein
MLLAVILSSLAVMVGPSLSLLAWKVSSKSPGFGSDHRCLPTVTPRDLFPAIVPKVRDDISYVRHGL